MKATALDPDGPVKGHVKFGSLLTQIWKNRMVYTLLLPGLIWLLLFAYLPMGGLSLAFKDYKANLGIWGSPWAGFENFKYVFRDPAFIDALWRTLYINIIKLVIQFPFPILLALMLNELRMRRTKKIFQTVFTFPHFLSWIIVSGVVINVLAYDGLVNSALALLGLPTINFLGSEEMFVPMLLLTDIWKSTGWGAIIYLAAISGIDQDQYESAQIDGASRMQQMFRITLPNILPTVYHHVHFVGGRPDVVGLRSDFQPGERGDEERVGSIGCVYLPHYVPVFDGLLVFHRSQPVPFSH